MRHRQFEMRDRGSELYLCASDRSPGRSGLKASHSFNTPRLETLCVDSRGCSASEKNLLFELSTSEGSRDRRPSVGNLLVRRPVAAVALLPQPLVLFSAGAFAGALGVL